MRYWTEYKKYQEFFFKGFISDTFHCHQDIMSDIIFGPRLPKQQRRVVKLRQQRTAKVKWSVCVLDSLHLTSGNDSNQRIQ